VGQDDLTVADVPSAGFPVTEAPDLRPFLHA